MNINESFNKGIALINKQSLIHNNEIVLETDEQIEALKYGVNIETDRDIYSFKFVGKEIVINGDWFIERDKKLSIHDDIIRALENYCSKDNIMWEQNSTYSAWCD